MSFFGSLFGIKKMNADPDQQVFARLFIAAAESRDMKGQIELTNWLPATGWPLRCTTETC